MIYNYHTHTHRCGHASGAEEEYIEAAIKNGIKYMGFSDHMPLKFADGSESGYRVPTAEGKIYCEQIKALSKKYKGKIDIKVGFEMEYYPELFDEMLKKAIEYGAEYLILGQHFIMPENLAAKDTFRATNSVDELKKYTKAVLSAIEKNIFTYVAHPDVFNYVGDVGIYQKEMRKICVASRENNVPLELNFLGIRQHRVYPNDAFWQIAGEEKSPVTFGFDAHEVSSAFDGESLLKAKQIVEKYNLNYIGIPKLRLIK
ncbi:MAG: histidinol-phosphatase [Clostridia bacterium]|nr:histidinol-phosphatase [Clostridia bacterium]